MTSSSTCKAWSVENMLAATNSITQENMSVREASWLYNLPFETLRWCVTGAIENGCRPGPGTVLITDEEDQLASYLVDMSFGLSRDTVLHLAFSIVDKSQ